MVSTMFCKAKSAKKNFFLHGNFKPLPNKNVQMLDHFFLLLFPKDSESLKIFDIRLWEVGAKNPAHGRHQLSRPMRLVEPIQNKTKCFYFFFKGKNHPKPKNSKMSRDMPKLAIRPLTRGLQYIGKRGFHHVL